MKKVSLWLVFAAFFLLQFALVSFWPGGVIPNILVIFLFLVVDAFSYPVTAAAGFALMVVYSIFAVQPLILFVAAAFSAAIIYRLLKRSLMPGTLFGLGMAGFAGFVSYHAIFFLGARILSVVGFGPAPPLIWYLAGLPWVFIAEICVFALLQWICAAESAERAPYAIKLPHGRLRS